MGKKLLVFILVSVMTLGVFGLAGCDNVSLNEYKATKSQALQDYADAKGESNYCLEDWTAVCDAVTAGKTAIETATTKPQVDMVFNYAKGVIDAIQEEGIGMFYTLQEAYDEDLLTMDDLRSIANYHTDGTSSTEALSAENVSAIKEVAAKNINFNSRKCNEHSL